jgi:hypothetical protein
LGFLWILVSYVVRLYVNVFVEPTINPVKHFPAVTVAAKLLVPYWITLTKLFGQPLLFLGEWLAYSIATLEVHALPGAVGFLVWESKANWRLYRSNRAATLQPAAIGHHGERLPRLLRPGFHSGTLPKLFAKLRRAQRRTNRGGDRRTVLKLQFVLHHIEASLRAFAERELLAFLTPPFGWSAGPVRLSAVEVGSNEVRYRLTCQPLGDEILELKFEEQEGWLLAHVAKPGWRARLNRKAANILEVAFVGFFKRAGVDLLREQIEAVLPTPCPPYDISEAGLVVWPGPGYDTEVVYDLRGGPLAEPRVIRGQPERTLPILDMATLLFRNRGVTWDDWVTAWDACRTAAADD